MSSSDGPEDYRITLERGGNDERPYFCVSGAKLTILSLATFGLYEVFWFYQNWKRVRDRTGRTLSPFWRAIFSPIFVFPLARTVASTTTSLNLRPGLTPGLVAAAYLGLTFLACLPDPWWLVSLFTFVPLLAVAREIRTIHEALQPGVDPAVGWGRGAWATLAFGGLLAGLAVLGTFAPPAHVLRDGEIPWSYEETLVDAGVLEPGEDVRFFYSAGLFSILDDGNLLTDSRVVSYWTESEQLHLYSAAYPEIREHRVEYSESYLDDSVVTISTRDGLEFVLILSPDYGRDREFVQDLERRIRIGRGREPPAGD